MKMKKWLLGCLLLAAVLCLMGMTPKAEADTVFQACKNCEKEGNLERTYIAKREGFNYDDSYHWVKLHCPNCGYDYFYIYGVGTEVETVHVSDGSRKATCTVGMICGLCGGEFGKLPHTWTSWVSKGDGQHTHHCTECSATETASCSGDPGATCVTLGTCTACGGQYYGGHSFPATWKWSIDGKNDNTGHWLVCNICEKEKGFFSAHLFVPSNMYLKSDATCVSRAIYYKNCSSCYYRSETETYEDPYGQLDPNNHDRVTREAKAPTCTEIGWDAYEACQREGCGYTTYTELPALNHDLAHHDAKAPSCTEKGWDAYDTCQRDGCDYTTYTELPALTHDLVHHDAKAPSCTEKGWAAYDTCQREGCGYTTYTELPALTHDLVHHDAKAPTCTEKGWNAYDTCTRCDYTTYVEIPANLDNHALIHVKAQAPTCTNHGWDAYDICQRCGYTTFKELPALGHWYGEWTPNGDGSQIAVCKRGCGHKAAVKCAEQEYTLPMGEGEETCEFTLCPVCGQVSDGTKLALVEKITAKAVTRWLPAGEAVLRLGTLENGEIVLIAGFEYAGQLTQPTGQIQFTLPAEHLKGFTLTVIPPTAPRNPWITPQKKMKPPSPSTSPTSKPPPSLST